MLCYAQKLTNQKQPPLSYSQSHQQTQTPAASSAPHCFFMTNHEFSSMLLKKESKSSFFAGP
jgi:hypothetical protein